MSLFGVYLVIGKCVDQAVTSPMHKMLEHSINTSVVIGY